MKRIAVILALVGLVSSGYADIWVFRGTCKGKEVDDGGKTKINQLSFLIYDNQQTDTENYLVLIKYWKTANGSRLKIYRNLSFEANDPAAAGDDIDLNAPLSLSGDSGKTFRAMAYIDTENDPTAFEMVVFSGRLNSIRLESGVPRFAIPTKIWGTAVKKGAEPSATTLSYELLLHERQSRKANVTALETFSQTVDRVWNNSLHRYNHDQVNNPLDATDPNYANLVP